jgi:hypothetical protein
VTAPRLNSRHSSHLVSRITGRLPGRTLIVIGAMHGNEPAGVRAIESVVHRLSSTHQIFRGEFIALVGNHKALEAQVRFLDRDLNRGWTGARVDTATSAEDEAQRTLTNEIEAAIAQARGPVQILDLHTMSGPGKPFTVFADTIRSRQFARAFRVPLLLGFEEHLDGALIDYLDRLGHAAVAIEGGRHDDPESEKTLTAAIWVAIGAAGLLANSGDDEIVGARRTLRAAVAGLPVALEITHRHGLDPDSNFSMKQDHASFDQVVQGQVIAKENGRDVEAHQNGFLILPRYQPLGDDGFFLARPVNAFWLALSRTLRLLSLGSLVPFFPGVTAVPSVPGQFLVSRQTAKWGALQVFHLLGYRRLEDDGTVFRVLRREEGVTA